MSIKGKKRFWTFGCICVLLFFRSFDFPWIELVKALRETLQLAAGDEAQSLRFNRSRQKHIEIESWNEMDETISQRSIPEQCNPNSRSSIRYLKDTVFSTNHSVLLNGFGLVPIPEDSTWMGTPANITIFELPNSNRLDWEDALYCGEVNMIENTSLVMLDFNDSTNFDLNLKIIYIWS